MFDTEKRPVNLAYSSHWPFAAALVWMQELTLEGTLKEWVGGDAAMIRANTSVEFPRLLEKLIAGRVPSRAWSPDGHSRALEPFEWLSVYLSWGSDEEGRADRWHPYINKRPDTSTILFRNAIFEAKALMREFPEIDVPTPFLFDGPENRLTLMQSAAFLALGGVNGLATLDQIEAAATARLFPALAEGRIEAVGILTKTMVPEAIPRGRWPLATLVPTEHGHLVEWFDRVFQAFGSGTMTVHEDRPFHGQAERPTWTRISIDRASLAGLLADGKTAPAAAQIGRPAKFDWERYVDFICERYDYFGPMGPDQPGWENQAAVETVGTKWLADQGVEVSESTVRSRTRDALKAAQGRKVGN